MIEGWYRDLVLGLRGLRRRPLFCLTAIFILALGIGANTAIFTLLYGLLLRSLPVAQPTRLARLNLVGPVSGSRTAEIGLSWQMLQQVRRQQHAFTDISAWSFYSVTMADSEGVLRMYPAMLVSGNAFDLLGVKPYLGRMLVPSDNVPGGPSQGWAVVLSYGFWNERFVRDPQVIGKQLQIGKVLVTIAGVLPPAFQGVLAGQRPQLYLPIRFVEARESGPRLEEPETFFQCYPIGRLKPGVTLAQANAEIATYKDGLIEHFVPRRFRDNPFVRKARLEVRSGRTGIPFEGDSIVGPLLLMQGLVGVVLVLCCVNVGGLMLSKIYERRHEFAVRSAVGAARWRLVRQYLTESFVIAGAGAVFGAMAAWYGSQALLPFFMDPMAQEGITVTPDWTAFLVTGAFAVLSTLLFGTVPAWLAGRADLNLLLRSRTLGGRRQIAGRAFVPIQVALSLVLVTVAGLLSESLIRMRSESLGFDVGHITLTTAQFQRLPQKDEALLDLYQRMVDRLNQMPGILSAAVTWYTPMTNDKATSSFQAITNAANPPEDTHMAFNEVGPGYFRTMQTRITAGREFERRDRDRSRCILNRSAADYLFPHQQPIGQFVRSMDRERFPDGVSCEVVGVAEDAKYASLRERPPRTIYFPMNPKVLATGNMVFLMRSAHKSEAIAGYRKTLGEIAPTTPLLRFATLQQQLDDSMGAQRLITILSNVFASLALFLSAIGLYGLLASGVAQRTSEIGVRLALGASRATVVRMVLYEALRLMAIGVLLGLGGLILVVRFVRGMLYGISAFNPGTLIGTALLLTTIAFIAALLPARHAASVDPMQALRAE